MRAFLLSRRALAISKLRQDFDSDLAMDPGPYGFDAAETMPGVEIAYSDGRSSESRVSEMSWRRLGFDLPHAMANLQAMRRADVVWTVIEWEWMAASMLQRMGLLQKKPIIGSCVFLGDVFPKVSRRGRYIWKPLMTDNVHLVMHSRPAIETMRSVLPEKEFHLLPFGISTRAFPIEPPVLQHSETRPIRIYSIGDDRGRDWTTLLAAFGNDDRFEIRIACRWLEDELREGYSNLTVLKSVTVSKQRELYRWADMVVLPLKQNVYSGITVACEAAAMGKALLASHTGGVDTYFDAAEVFYAPAGNPDALRDTVLNTTPRSRFDRAQAAQARFLRDDYSAKGMVHRYIQTSQRLLAPQSIEATSGQFQSELSR